MITKEDFFSSIRQEGVIVKHLASKIRPEDLNYRPGEKQRSTLELIQYLSYCGKVATSFVISGSWDAAKKMSEDAKLVNLDNFSDAMDAQMNEIEILLKRFDNKTLSEMDSKTPWGAPQKAGLGLINTTLKFLTAYRMQLFLYLKDSGNTGLSTSNCWMGMDPAPKK